MEAYPGPWILFSVGEGRVGIFRPQAVWWHVFQIDGEWLEHGPFGGKLTDFKPVDATGASDKLYLLGTERKPGTVPVVEGERHVGPKNSFELEIAGGFHPKMIRLSGGSIYLADGKGAVTSYDLESALKSGQLMDHPPALVSDLDAVRVAVAKSGYSGRATIRLNLGADGSVGDVRVEPAFLTKIPEVMGGVARLRFQPKFEGGQAVAAPVSLEIGVP